MPSKILRNLVLHHHWQVDAKRSIKVRVERESRFHENPTNQIAANISFHCKTWEYPLRPRRAWEKQQAFIANASHELRTPLNLIRASKWKIPLFSFVPKKSRLV